MVIQTPLKYLPLATTPIPEDSTSLIQPRVPSFWLLANFMCALPTTKLFTPSPTSGYLHSSQEVAPSLLTYCTSSRSQGPIVQDPEDFMDTGLSRSWSPNKWDGDHIIFPLTSFPLNFQNPLIISLNISISLWVSSFQEVSENWGHSGIFPHTYK